MRGIKILTTYGWYTVGVDDCVSITEHLPQTEADKRYYDIAFSNGNIIRAFDFEQIEFERGEGEDKCSIEETGNMNKSVEEMQKNIEEMQEMIMRTKIVDSYNRENFYEIMDQNTLLKEQNRRMIEVLRYVLYCKLPYDVYKTINELLNKIKGQRI